MTSLSAPIDSPSLPVVHVVCGPTAAGKSRIAMSLAARHGLTIISADSRQIYRDFDIGTAKPRRADTAAVPHRGIDLADPAERWSAARWSGDATHWIDELGAGRVLVVGGTGLYLRALFEPLFAEPPLPAPSRAALRVHLDDLSVHELRRWVLQLDPAKSLLGRTQLMRAIETVLLTGRRLSDLHREQRRPARFRPRWLVIDPVAALQEQIATRLDAMLADGWIDEAAKLAKTVDANAPAWQACGYAAVRDVALGARKLAAARTTILVETRQFAKRQRTWFRHQLDGAEVVRLDPRSPGADAAAHAWWNPEERV